MTIAINKFIIIREVKDLSGKEVVRLEKNQRCVICGSAGSIEFDMCQVCLFDYAKFREATGVEIGGALKISEAGLDDECGLGGSEMGYALSSLPA